MSVARKIAGVTKDNKVYETLESRFGMFLANNTQGAEFTIQCVGLASTTHMELAGDVKDGDDEGDSAFNVLIDDRNSTEGALAEAEVLRDRMLFRKSLELGNREVVLASLGLNELQRNNEKEDKSKRLDKTEAEVPLQHASVTGLKKAASSENLQRAETTNRQLTDYKGQLQPPGIASDVVNGNQDSTDTVQFEILDLEEDEGKSLYTPATANPPSRSNTADSESSFTGRLTRKASTVLKGAIKSLKPSGISQIHSNVSMDSLKPTQPQSQSSSRPNSRLSDYSHEEFATQCDDLEGDGFPTIRTSSRPGGHFEDILSMTHEQVEAHRRQSKDADTGVSGHPRFLKLHAYHHDMPSPSHGVVNLIDPKGISIISDIDDTIKETNVTAGARIILRNTFLRDMQDVKGMADVYRKWCNQGAAVHYVSNSPWQLIPSLLQFFHNHRFPPGSAHLRLHGNVIKTYFMQPGENKRKAIREILEDFPERKFILVGDSGEIDMEIYTAMAVKYPYQVQKIFIRDITTARLRDMASRTSPSRTLSLSSLLPKTATGARLFSRTTTSTISSTTITGDGDNTEDIPRTSSPEELSVDDPVTMEEGTPFARLAPGLSDMASASPKDEPSGSLTPPTVLTAASTSSPLNSPRLQPKQITTGFKVKSSPLSFKRSSSNDRNKKSGELGSIGTRARANTISPSSTLSTESVSNEYPFPRRGSVASSSADTSILQQSDNTSWDHDNQAEQFISSSLTSAALSTSASHSHVITHVITHCQTSISSSTFSKGLLELWLERVDQCRQKLPEGVLTLFESAEELEQCPIVKNLFKEHADDVQQVNKQEEGDCEDKEQEQEEVENGQGIEDNVSGRMEGLTSDTCLQEAAFDSIKIQNIGVADDTCVVTCIV